MKNKILVIDTRRCKSCGLCIAVCPKKTLAIGTELNQQGYAFVEQVKLQDCIKCNLCRTVCPDIAIGVMESVES